MAKSSHLFPMITLRVTVEEREALNAESEQNGISLNVHIRRMLGLPDLPNRQQTSVIEIPVGQDELNGLTHEANSARKPLTHHARALLGLEDEPPDLSTTTSKPSRPQSGKVLPKTPNPILRRS